MDHATEPTTLAAYTFAPPLRARATEVRAARHELRKLASPLIGEDAAHEVELMAAEAISNTIVHGHGVVTVSAECNSEVFRVEVRDEGPGLAVASRVDHGRGHQLIAGLAARWEFTTGEAGTCLWFEVDLVL